MEYNVSIVFLLGKSAMLFFSIIDYFYGHQKSNLPSHCLVLKINQWRIFFSQIGIVLLRSRSQFRSPTAIFSAWRTINRLAVCSKDFKSPLWDVQWTKLSLKKWKVANLFFPCSTQIISKRWFELILQDRKFI